MLFDLRGGGRRRTVQVVYIALAVIMGGGLILFGIGGAVSGGLVDAITNGGNGSASTNAGTYQKREAAAVAATKANPKDPQAWADLARARFLLANAGDNYNQATGVYSAQGQRILASAGTAWQHHLKLAKNPDSGIAGIMVQVYSALGDGTHAVEAQEVITQDRPSGTTFATLAILAYQAGQTRKGDLARAKALQLTDKDQRNTMKSQIDEAKQQAAAAAPTATPSPTATAAPKSKKKSKK